MCVWELLGDSREACLVTSSRGPEPRLGVCSCGGGLSLLHRGVGGYLLMLKLGVSPSVILLFCPPTSTASHSFLPAWVPLAQEPRADLASGLTSLDV